MPSPLLSTVARPTLLRRIRLVAELLALVSVVILGIGWLAHRRFVARLPRVVGGDLRPKAAVTGIPVEVLSSVGDIEDLRLKPLAHGGIRVLALGEAETFGGEVIAGFDYPAALQRLLGDAEVINAGNTLYSLTQSYHLWDAFFSRQKFDFVLLDLARLQIGPEMTFNHVERYRPDYLHGRYILSGEDLVFVDPGGGDTAAGRVASYYRFPPQWRYLRYDRRAPPFLRALFPEDQILENPFYYSSLGKEEERNLLYRGMLARLAHGDHHTVILVQEPAAGPLLPSGPGVTIVRFAPVDTFLYRRPFGQYGPLGNELIAQVYCHVLAPARCPAPVVLEVSDAAAITGVSSLTGASRMELLVDGRATATLIHVPTSTFNDRASAPVDLDHEGVRSLLLFPGKPSLFDGLVLPLSFPLRDGASLSLRHAGHQQLLGRLQASAAVGVVVSQHLEAKTRPPRVAVHGVSLADLPAELVVDDQPIGELTAEGELRPAHPFAFFRPLGKGVIDVRPLPESGELRLRISGREQQEAVVGRWRKVPLDLR